MDISLEYYRVFYQVARLGSITLAAEHLCISQPAVSQAVKQLETALTCRLCKASPPLECCLWGRLQPGSSTILGKQPSAL